MAPEPPRPHWGDLLKLNRNGTYFGSPISNVNRDHCGYIEFEKMIGLGGIAIINIVSNLQAAAVTGAKELHHTQRWWEVEMIDSS